MWRIYRKIYFSEKHLFIGTFTYALQYNVYRTSKNLISPWNFYITGTLVWSKIHGMWDFGTFTYALPYNVDRTGKNLYVEYFSVEFLHKRDLSIKQDSRFVGLWFWYSRLQTQLVWKNRYFTKIRRDAIYLSYNTLTEIFDSEGKIFLLVPAIKF